MTILDAILSAPSAGIARVGLDGTLYDQVLDFIFYLGLAPKRFQVRLLFLPLSRLLSWLAS